MNRVEIRGGLTRDAEFNFSQGGTPYLGLTVAVNGTRYDGSQRTQVVKTTYVRVVAFGQAAEAFADLDLKKGDEVYVLGELDNSERENADGTKERKTSVAAFQITPTRRRSSRTRHPAPGQSTAPAPEDDPWAAESVTGRTEPPF